MKTINLAKALTHNKMCIGYAWQVSKGKYEVQNDNDLGLDLELIDGEMRYNKKVYVGNGYYFYVMYGLWNDDKSNGVTLNMAKLLLKECHSALFTLSKREKKRLEEYWGQF